MSFLPEDDQDFLKSKGIPYELKEKDNKRGVLFPAFRFQGNLFQLDKDGALTPCEACDLLVLIPDGYDTTKLDSFYTRPTLKRPDGNLPDRATVIQNHFDQEWQFWSRHLSDEEWQQSARGFEVYLDYIREALRSA